MRSDPTGAPSQSKEDDDNNPEGEDGDDEGDEDNHEEESKKDDNNPEGENGDEGDEDRYEEESGEDSSDYIEPPEEHFCPTPNPETNRRKLDGLVKLSNDYPKFRPKYRLVMLEYRSPAISNIRSIPPPPAPDVPGSPRKRRRANKWSPSEPLRRGPKRPKPFTGKYGQ